MGCQMNNLANLLGGKPFDSYIKTVLTTYSSLKMGEHDYTECDASYVSILNKDLIHISIRKSGKDYSFNVSLIDHSFDKSFVVSRRTFRDKFFLDQEEFEEYVFNFSKQFIDMNELEKHLSGKCNCPDY